MPEENKQPTNRSVAKQGYAEKAAWMRAVTRDPALSARAKLLAHVAAWELAGHKGHFKATRKRLADLIGESLGAVRRAIAELDSQNYWDIEASSGECNIYHLITPEDRLARWERAKLDYRHECDSWAYAERVHKRRIEAWLDAERQFHDQQKFAEWLYAEAMAKKSFVEIVLEALCGRGVPPGTAAEGATQAWEAHLPLEAALAQIAGLPDESIAALTARNEPTSPTGEPTPAHLWADPGSPVNRPRFNSSALTSEEGHSHKSFKVSQDFKFPQKAAGRAEARAHPAALQEQPALTPCPLCDQRGLFLDVDGWPVVVIDEEGYREEQVRCQHSFEGNLREIRRIEDANAGDWGIARTGWDEIDSHYSYLANSCD
ncbi:Uncharacterised protein [Mycobacteroides abscessus subsp. bolletii]|uniref:hypothetical protein n=1 Tax=Mycobacteroides abscessus TaxID=36809 RepID=UPI0009A7981B|nr:hypothetical protein [Mycobacteroides abscessus]SLB52168.1 Uncharacterised protein [Mycobacteroides abscessus subsp. bolletii]